MDLTVEVVDALRPSPSYGQNAFRLLSANGAARLQLALHIPDRLAEDTRAASQKQRDTLEAFFLGHDLLPPACGWQQASALLDIRSLSFAVAETLRDGFFAANRVTTASLIATYISRSPFLCAVARGWSLGARKETAEIAELSWRFLVGSAYFKELFNFSAIARDDLVRAMAELEKSADQQFPRLCRVGAIDRGRCSSQQGLLPGASGA